MCTFVHNLKVLTTCIFSMKWFSLAWCLHHQSFQSKYQAEPNLYQDHVYLYTPSLRLSKKFLKAWCLQLSCYIPVQWHKKCQNYTNLSLGNSSWKSLEFLTVHSRSDKILATMSFFCHCPLQTLQRFHFK